MLRLIKLPANNSWVFVFGETVETSTIVPIDGDRFYATRRLAKLAARSHGIYITRDGICRVLDCCDEVTAHSQDLVTVLCGYYEPAIVCGRHAQTLGSATLAHIRARLS